MALDKTKLVENLVRTTMDINSPIKGLIVSGPPGGGKTFITRKVAREVKHPQVRYHKGYTTPFQLYHQLLEGRESIIVFDDCDAAFNTNVAYNLIKGACDPESNYEVEYRSRQAEVAKFNFDGKLIILSNYRFRSTPHYTALLDRMQYFYFALTKEELLIKLHELAQQMIAEGENAELIYGVLEWMIDLDRDVSYRVFTETYKLATQFPNDWLEYVPHMVLKESELEPEVTA